jgi:hypothetical protein
VTTDNKFDHDKGLSPATKLIASIKIPPVAAAVRLWAIVWSKSRDTYNALLPFNARKAKKNNGSGHSEDGSNPPRRLPNPHEKAVLIANCDPVPERAHAVLQLRCTISDLQRFWGRKVGGWIQSPALPSAAPRKHSILGSMTGAWTLSTIADRATVVAIET